MSWTDHSSAAKSLLRETWGPVTAEWEIKNFCDLSSKEDAYLDSSTFLLPDVEWYIRIYPNGDTAEQSAGLVSLLLVKKETSSEYRVSFTLGIKKADGSTLMSFDDTEKFKKEEAGQGPLDFISRSELLESAGILTPDGSLLVFCTALLIDIVSTGVEPALEASSTDGTCQMYGKDDVDTTPPKYINTPQIVSLQTARSHFSSADQKVTSPSALK